MLANSPSADAPCPALDEGSRRSPERRPLIRAAAFIFFILFFIQGIGTEASSVYHEGRTEWDELHSGDAKTNWTKVMTHMSQ